MKLLIEWTPLSSMPTHTPWKSYKKPKSSALVDKPKLKMASLQPDHWEENRQLVVAPAKTVVIIMDTALSLIGNLEQGQPS